MRAFQMVYRYIVTLVRWDVGALGWYVDNVYIIPTIVGTYQRTN